MQTQLVQHIMRTAQHLHLLIPSIRSSALRPEEGALRGKLEETEEEMRRARVKGRLLVLLARGWKRPVVDEEGLAQVAQILVKQQAVLLHLTKILREI